jgi:hypothetical protein
MPVTGVEQLYQPPSSHETHTIYTLPSRTLTCVPLPLQDALRAVHSVGDVDPEVVVSPPLREVAQAVIRDLQLVPVQTFLGDRRVHVVVGTDAELEVAAQVVGHVDRHVHHPVNQVVGLGDHALCEHAPSLVLATAVPRVATYATFPAQIVPLALKYKYK